DGRVRLGVEAVALEDNEPRVDAFPTLCLDVRPGNAGGVDGTVSDPQPPRLFRAAAHEESRSRHTATLPSPLTSHLPLGWVGGGGWVRPRLPPYCAAALRHRPRGSRSRSVPLDLVEVAQRRSPRPHACPERRQFLVRDLAERTLDAEPRDVQILLVHDRRDPRVDLDHLLADELDVEEVLDLELGDEPASDLLELRIVERDEVHREPGAHRLARLRVAEHDPPPVGDPVDRALAAGRELHY